MSFLLRFSCVSLVAVAFLFAFSSVSFANTELTENNKKVACGFNVPESPYYDAHFLTVRRHLRVEPGSVFQVKVFMKNTGNIPWFSGDSGCMGSLVYLGTEKSRDRSSSLYAEGLEGWRGGNRIMMDQYRVNPGDVASFTFEAAAPTRNVLFKEFFAPVVSGVQWIDNAKFHFDLIVGHGGSTAKDAMLKLEYANRSGPVDYVNLNAEKLVLLKLSERVVYLKLGNEVIRAFPISPGKPSTPTPVGTTQITLKQDVRIGGAPPHYIMPKFMWFRAGGYGFHALPSIGSASLRAEIRRLQAAGQEVPTSLYYGDALWREALDHIGKAVSHGCVRLLPEDANWMYDFVELGTKVVVER